MAEAAPAAAAAKTAAPPATPSGKVAASFDTRLALAKSLGHPRPAAAEPAIEAAAAEEPASDSVAAADAADEADRGEASETAADAEGSGAEQTEGDSDSDGAAPGTDAERLAAAAKAVEAGDIDALVKALQADGKKILAPVRRAFHIHARRQRALQQEHAKFERSKRDFEQARAKAQQEIADESRKLSHLQRETAQRFGWASQMQRAWEDEDYVEVGKMLERGCKGASLATITQKLATGKQGKSSEERALDEKRRKIAEEEAALEAKKRQSEDTQTRAQKREAAIGRMGEALKSHPYLLTTNDKGEKVQDPEALDEVFRAWEGSWNGEKFTKSARQIADELQAKLEARAKARGLAPAPKAPPPPPKTPSANGKRAPAPRPRLPEPPRTSNPKRGTPEDLEASRAARVAAARRITEMQKRGVR